METTKKQFESAEKKMNELLALATKNGGFNNLNKKENADLEKYTQIVNSFEATNYSIPLPETLQGLIELKMYENKLKQKELAQKLNITDTKLSEIMHKKRKPNISFLKSLHEVFNIDGNLLLRMV
ncbi:MAG: helix-turn-helix transcriptional regulator [Bacteroidota bacterium]